MPLGYQVLLGPVRSCKILGWQVCFCLHLLLLFMVAFWLGWLGRLMLVGWLLGGVCLVVCWRLVSWLFGWLSYQPRSQNAPFERCRAFAARHAGDFKVWYVGIIGIDLLRGNNVCFYLGHPFLFLGCNRFTFSFKRRKGPTFIHLPVTFGLFPNGSNRKIWKASVRVALKKSAPVSLSCRLSYTLTLFGKTKATKLLITNQLATPATWCTMNTPTSSQQPFKV